MKKNFKEIAINMRRAGYSYALIRRSVPVSKSTLTVWLRDIPYQPNGIVQNRIMGAAQNIFLWQQERKRKSIDRARKFAKETLGSLSKRDLLLFGLGVYVGEGSKTQGVPKIVNSDPEVICLAVLWFNRVFGVPMENFSVSVHIYPDDNERNTVVFWSKKTGIPMNQFGKTQVDTRVKKTKKRGMLRHGTAHVRVRAARKTEYGVALFRKILALIEESYAQINSRD